MAEGEPCKPLVLKHSECLKCGYLLAGIEVQAGYAICPECGHPNPLDPSASRSRRSSCPAGALMWLVAAGAIGAGLAWLMGLPMAGAVLVFAGAITLMLAVVLIGPIRRNVLRP